VRALLASCLLAALAAAGPGAGALPLDVCAPAGAGPVDAEACATAQPASGQTVGAGVVPPDLAAAVKGVRAGDPAPVFVALDVWLPGTAARVSVAADVG
jgi:hypothetical protein